MHWCEQPAGLSVRGVCLNSFSSSWEAQRSLSSRLHPSPLPAWESGAPGRADGRETRSDWSGFRRVSRNGDVACGGAVGVATGVTVSVSRKRVS